MSLKIKKNKSLIDQHDKNFMYGGKFGGNFIPETLKKPIDDFSDNCDAHYKYGLQQIERDMRARGSAFSAAEQRLLE